MKKLLLLLLVIQLIKPNLTKAGANLGELSLQKTVRNLTDQGNFSQNAEIHLGEEVEFKIEVKSINNINIIDVIVSDTFPSHLLEYIQGSLTVNGQSYPTGLTNGGLRFASITSSPTVIIYKAKIIQDGQSQNTSTAIAQNANQVSSVTSISIPYSSHQTSNTVTTNPNTNSTTNSTSSGTITNQSLINELAEHACLHVQNGPDRAVTATNQTQGAPDISKSHTRFNISLSNNKNYVAFSPPSSGDYIFLLNQNIPIKIINSSGGEVSTLVGSSTTCPTAIKQIVTELTNGIFYLEIGSGSNTVNLVVEKADQNIFNPSSVSGVNTFTAPETGSNVLLPAFAFGVIISLISFLAFRRFN